MNKINIPFKSESADVTYKKGDRIIVNAGVPRKPEYYTAKITMVRAGKYHLMFDDGDKGAVDDIKDIVGYANDKQCMTSFGRKDLRLYQLSTKSRPKSKVVAKKKRVRVVKKDVVSESNPFSEMEKQHATMVSTFNSDLQKLAKTERILGNKFRIVHDKKPELLGMGLSSIVVVIEKVKFEIAFLDNSTSDGKDIKIIQVSSTAKPGVTEKRVSGKNASAKGVITKIKTLFDKGKW